MYSSSFYVQGCDKKANAGDNKIGNCTVPKNIHILTTGGLLVPPP